MNETFSAAARRERLIDAAVERDMAKLRDIKDAILEAARRVLYTGPPAHAYVAGEDYKDYIERLRDLVPDVSANAEAKLRETITDRANGGEIV